MQRTRVNGKKFEKEIERYCAREEVCAFLVRLRAPQVKLANITNIADYLLFAKRTIVLEAKETKASSFSLKDFQQKEQLETFKPFYANAESLYGSPLPYRAVVLVHFIAEGKYTAYFVDKGDFKVIRPDDPDCVTADSLPEIMELLLC